ncbi:tetratricopeptide repeat protein [Inmirania thermothiophila]|uniref:Tetratricopeptide repeat protein n=1 Tax=Inmirania thermothiophila TaxID=1750597 RepID=A0A3N1XWC6_9GAMM|nr:tetratricopeptide repeat protein [Inmirania thermothiophila]ROR29502.1 tetratricopeptide repeat protein [Inmirania thermothiophila]
MWTSWIRRPEPLLAAAVLVLAGCAAQPPAPPPAPSPSRPAPEPQPAGPAPQADRAALEAGFAEALARLRAGDDDDARPILEALAARPDAPAGVHLNLALLLRRAGEPQAALAAVERALAAAPRWAPALNLRGVLLREQGRLAEAEKAYRAAIRADRRYALAHHNLGVLEELFLGRPDEALKAYRRYLELAGGDPTVAAWAEALAAHRGGGDR